MAKSLEDEDFVQPEVERKLPKQDSKGKLQCEVSMELLKYIRDYGYITHKKKREVIETMVKEFMDRNPLKKAKP